MKKTQFGMIGARSASLAAIAALGIGTSLFNVIAPDARDYDRGPVGIPQRKVTPRASPPPPPNPKAERRKMMAVRAMQERKRKQRQGLK